MKPICFNCQRYFRAKKTGFYFTEGMPINGAKLPKPGKDEADKWQPYKVWSGDKWECLGCSAVIIVGCGLRSITERHKDNFQAVINDLNADQFQVNDC